MGRKRGKYEDKQEEAEEEV